MYPPWRYGQIRGKHVLFAQMDDAAAFGRATHNPLGTSTLDVLLLQGLILKE